MLVVLIFASLGSAFGAGLAVSGLHQRWFDVMLRDVPMIVAFCAALGTTCGSAVAAGLQLNDGRPPGRLAATAAAGAFAVSLITCAIIAGFTSEMPLALQRAALGGIPLSTGFTFVVVCALVMIDRPPRR